MISRSMFAAAGLLAISALPGLAPAAQAKDDLVIGVAQFPSSLHPDIDAEVIRSYVNDFVIRPITAFDPEWKNSCLLCSELPTIQNGLAKFEDTPDGGKGMAVTLKLKPDLKWGDGVPVTTKDLLFTWKLALDPASGFSNSHPWDRASKIDIIDDHTAVLHLKKVDVAYNQWDQILPEHIEGPVVAASKQPGDYIKETKFNRAPTTAGLYDGPYVISQYQSGSQIVFDPNPNWSGAKPGFKHIVIKLIENTAALQANLLSGDVDMVAGEGVGLTIDQVIGLQKQYPDKFVYIFKPSLTYEHIDLQKTNPILADINVRHAMLYAMDRKLLVDKLFAGHQPVATTWVNPLDPNYSAAVATYPFDLPKAKSLLAEAGWKPGSDGICRNAKGDRLSVEFSTTSGNRLRELTQQVLQNQLKGACIEATIKNEPPRTLFGETLKQRTYTGMVMYAWSSNVNESPRRTLGSDNIPTKQNNYGGANYIAFDNKEMDADIAKAESELDPEKQKVIWADMEKIYADQLPALPLFYRAEPHVVPKWLKGYTPTGTGDMSPLWSENWTSG
jgi:peptide/nickel transport system substrate-binding protein